MCNIALGDGGGLAAPPKLFGPPVGETGGIVNGAMTEAEVASSEGVLEILEVSSTEAAFEAVVGLLVGLRCFSSDSVRSLVLSITEAKEEIMAFFLEGGNDAICRH